MHGLLHPSPHISSLPTRQVSEFQKKSEGPNHTETQSILIPAEFGSMGITLGIYSDNGKVNGNYCVTRLDKHIGNLFGFCGLSEACLHEICSNTRKSEPGTSRHARKPSDITPLPGCCVHLVVKLKGRDLRQGKHLMD